MENYLKLNMIDNNCVKAVMERVVRIKKNVLDVKDKEWL
jgi:hypothetical protein